MNITTSMTWGRLRKLVQKRDSSKCFHCGKIDENGECDHLIPISKGGTDSIFNLVWSCSNCNRSKRDKLELLEETPSKKLDILSNTNKPKFDAIIPKLINDITIKFISPYPDYIPDADYIAYFELIEFMASIPIVSWLRECIWPIPKNAQLIIEQLKILKNFKDNLKYTKKIESIEDFPCVVCGCSVIVEFQKEKYYSTTKWLCPAGHHGTGIYTDLKVWMERMRVCAIEYARERTIPLPPSLWFE